MYSTISAIVFFALAAWYFYRQRLRTQAAEHYRVGDYSEAIRHYTRAIRLHPFDAYSYYCRAASYEKLGNIDAALTDYSTAIKRDRHDGAAYRRRAAIYEQLGNDAAAQADTLEAMRLHPEEDVVSLKKGMDCHKQGNYQEALTHFSQAVESLQKMYDKYQRFGVHMSSEDMNPMIRKRLWVAHFMCGYSRAALGQDDRAITDFDNALQFLSEEANKIGDLSKQHDYSVADIYRYRGISHARLEQWEKALADYDTAAEHGLDTRDLVNRRVWALINLKRWDEALADCDRVTELLDNETDLSDDESTNERSQIHNYRGIVHARSNRHQEAIESYTESLRCVENVWALNNRGETYFELGQFDQALEDFGGAHTLQEDLAIATAGLAVTQHVLGNTDDALALWRTLLEKDSQYADVEWVKTTLHWTDTMVREAGRIIARLGVD